MMEGGREGLTAGCWFWVLWENAGLQIELHTLHTIHTLHTLHTHTAQSVYTERLMYTELKESGLL